MSAASPSPVPDSDVVAAAPTQNTNDNPSANLEAAISEPKPQPKKQKSRRPNYAKIHAKSLPLEVFPLPAFVPHNPLSLFSILSALVSEFISRRTSHPTEKYIGYFSRETRSIHVTDPKHARALWEMGFFGKGTLSRSEPTWLDRERARRKAAAGGTSEEFTNERREARKVFKLERARAEREAIEEQLKKEGKLVEVLAINGSALAGTARLEIAPATTSGAQKVLDDKRFDLERQVADGEEDIEDQEHLQLTLHEAFFLAYGLGVLTIKPSPDSRSDAEDRSWTCSELLSLLASHSTFPPSPTAEIRPDNHFLLSYVVYHHYRSLGWVVRPGLKFAADWMLYNRGPVFSHAEFAVIIVPEYPEQWDTTWGADTRKRQKTWWELHCTNRVQGQVVKTLVLCYVQVPLAADAAGGDLGKVLGSYKVRDFVLRRWLPNRSRD